MDATASAHTETHKEYNARLRLAVRPKQYVRQTIEDRMFLEGCGGRMKDSRAALNLSQSVVAESIKIPSESYQKIERGLKDPGLVVAWRLAEVLQRSISYLTNDEDQAYEMSHDRASSEETHTLLRLWSSMGVEDRRNYLIMGKAVMA